APTDQPLRTLPCCRVLPPCHRRHSPDSQVFHCSLLVSGSVAITVTTSLGVVCSWTSTTISTSHTSARPNGARRVIQDSLVVHRLNKHSPLLSSRLQTPRRA